MERAENYTKIGLLRAIWQEMKAANDRPRPAVMYFLDAKPPFAQAIFPGGDTYRVFQDGKTQWMAGRIGIPIPACPCPEVIWSLNTGVFAWKHRARIPLAIAVLLALAALQFWLSLVPGAPATAWFVDYFAVVMNTALITLAGVCVIAAGLYYFRNSLIFKWGEDDELSGLLQAGQPDITPDILVMSASPDETPAQFVERIREAKYEQLPAGQYMLILTFRTADGLVVRNPDNAQQIVFDRANIKADLPGWVQEVSEPRMFERETWNDYIAYVRAFCIQFADWAKRDKVRQGDWGTRDSHRKNDPLKNIMDEMRAAATKAAAVLLPLLFAFNLNAQDLQQAGSARPIPERYNTGGASIFSEIPDSVTAAQMKAAFMVELARDWKTVGPTVDFYMWRFERILILLVGFGGMLWVFAMVSGRDSIKDFYGMPLFGNLLTKVHIGSKGILFIIMAIIIGAYMTEATVRYYYTGKFPTLGTLLKWAVICYASYRVFEFILPDTPGSKPEHIQQRGGPAIGPGNYPRA